MWIYAVAGLYTNDCALVNNANVLFVPSANAEKEGDVVSDAGRAAAYKRSPIRKSKTSRTTSMASSERRGCARGHEELSAKMCIDQS